MPSMRRAGRTATADLLTKVSPERKASRAAKVDLLTKVSLFAECNKKELAQIADATHEIHVPSGTVLVEQGAKGDRFFVVVEGLAWVAIDGKKVNSIHPGSFFGEMALLDQGPRSATVTAELPTRLLVLDARSFAGLVHDNPSVALKIMKGLAERLRNAERPATH